MTTIHIIESAEERALVKRIFRERMKDVAEAVQDLTVMNDMNGDADYNLNGHGDHIVNNGALVYDIKDGGDPELGWMVYDFRGDGCCYAVEEHGLAGLVNELPSNVFPF